MNLVINRLVSSSRLLMAASRSPSRRGGTRGVRAEAEADRQAVAHAVTACEEAVRARYGHVPREQLHKILKANMVLKLPDEEVDNYLENCL